MADSLWSLNYTQIQLQLDGLLQLRDVQLVEVNGNAGEQFEAGHRPFDVALVILITQTTKTFLIALFILLLVSRWITRPSSTWPSTPAA